MATTFLPAAQRIYKNLCCAVLATSFGSATIFFKFATQGSKARKKVSKREQRMHAISKAIKFSSCFARIAIAVLRGMPINKLLYVQSNKRTKPTHAIKASSKGLLALPFDTHVTRAPVHRAPCEGSRVTGARVTQYIACVAFATLAALGTHKSTTNPYLRLAIASDGRKATCC